MAKQFNLFDYSSQITQNNILICYKGPVTNVIIAEISRDIRHKFSDNPRLSRKLFGIFIELAQNILFYSVERVFFGSINESAGIIVITEEEDRLIFSCGNMVHKDDAEELLAHCDKINRLNRDDLREFKRQKRSAEQGTKSKGGGIGLIHVALTADNPLDVTFTDVDGERAFFALSVVLDK